MHPNQYNEVNQIASEGSRDGTLGMYSSRRKKSGNEEKPERVRNNLRYFQKPYEQESMYSTDVVFARLKSKQEIPPAPQPPAHSLRKRKESQAQEVIVSSAEAKVTGEKAQASCWPNCIFPSGSILTVLVI